MAYFEQPLRKLLGTLSPTINYLSERGSVDVNSLPAEHLEAIKQLERIGVVHKRNNRLYELQKIRLRKLMNSMGMDSLSAIAAEAEEAVATTDISHPAETVIAPAASIIPEKPIITGTAAIMPDIIAQIDTKPAVVESIVNSNIVSPISPVSTNVESVSVAINEQTSLN